MVSVRIVNVLQRKLRADPWQRLGGPDRLPETVRVTGRCRIFPAGWPGNTTCSGTLAILPLALGGHFAMAFVQRQLDFVLVLLGEVFFLQLSPNWKPGSAATASRSGRRNSLPAAGCRWPARAVDKRPHNAKGERHPAQTGAAQRRQVQAIRSGINFNVEIPFARG